MVIYLKIGLLRPFFGDLDKTMNGDLRQRPNGRWKVQYGFNKHYYIKTFDTKEECINYVNTLKQQLFH
jgi:hypothetical protein